jgi:hypothetical protein
MKTLLSATCLLIACNAVRASDPTATAGKKPAAAPVTQAAPSSIYSPKTRSVFTASANQHNPFWPIGWVKIESESATDSSAPLVPHAEDFLVTTILLNEPPMAVINGKEMAEGEVAALPVEGQNVVVQLMAVQDGRVILRWENQNLVVPIHREEELNEPVAVLR